MSVSKGEIVGMQMANAIIGMLNMMYNVDTATRVLKALIIELELHIKDFKRKED